MEDSILHDRGAAVGRAPLSGAILCQGASAEAKAVLEEGAVLGAPRNGKWGGGQPAGQGLASRRVEAGETLSADRKGASRLGQLWGAGPLR